MNTAKENLLQPYAGNTAAFNSTPLTQQRPLNYQVNTAKENLLQPYAGNTASFNSTPLSQKRPDNYQVNTAKEEVLQQHTGIAAPFNNTEARQAPLGATAFVQKATPGRLNMYRGPNIANVDVRMAINRKQQIPMNLTTPGSLQVPSTERLPTEYRLKNQTIDLTERLDPCLNAPFASNPYANAYLF